MVPFFFLFLPLMGQQPKFIKTPQIAFLFPIISIISVYFLSSWLLQCALCYPTLRKTLNWRGLSPRTIFFFTQHINVTHHWSPGLSFYCLSKSWIFLQSGSCSSKWELLFPTQKWLFKYLFCQGKATHVWKGGLGCTQRVFSGFFFPHLPRGFIPVLTEPPGYWRGKAQEQKYPIYSTY